MLQNPTPARSRRCVRHKHMGLVTFVNLVFLLLCVLMIAFTVNTTHIIANRTEMQHMADAASVSANQTQTRMMNSLTSTNHVIGEMLALVVVHHAIGGDLLDELEEASTDELTQADTKLDIAYDIAEALGGVTDLTAYDTVSENDDTMVGEATLLDSKIKLKELLAIVYAGKAAGRAMQKYPPTTAAGQALEWAMHPLELKILQEFKTLIVLEKAARSLIRIKQLVQNKFIPNAKRYTNELVQLAPGLMQQAAEDVVAKFDTHSNNEYVVELYSPSELGLPVVIDPHATASSQPDIDATEPIPSAGCCSCGSDRTEVNRDQIVKTSQLARAMFPWVIYHREPLLVAMKLLLPLANSAEYYKDYTDGYSKEFCNKMQEDDDLGLYVLKEYPGPDKGYAMWSEDRDEADLYFSTAAVVWAPASSVIGSPVAYQSHQPNGQIAVAQSLLYNANPWKPHDRRIDLTCKRITPNRQADFGQDTLNWKTPAWELIAKTDQDGEPSPDFPAIQVNWQTKLVPMSSYMYDELREDADSFEDDQLANTVEQLLEETPAALVAH